MKSIGFFFVLIATISLGQSGVNCNSAINITSSNIAQYTNQNTIGNSTWFKYIASTNRIRLEVISPNFGMNSTHIHSIELYKGNCNNLELIQSDELPFVDSSNYLSIDVVAPNLIIGNVYYIKVNRSSTIDKCDKSVCTANGSCTLCNFNIRIREIDLSIPNSILELSTESPHNFEENRGQVRDLNNNMADQILFFNQDHYPQAYVLQDRISMLWSEIDTLISLDTLQRVDMIFPKSKTHEIFSASISQGYNNYYVSHFPKGILKNFSFNRIIKQDIYPGIDLHFTIDNNKLRYQFIVHPYAEANDIQVLFSGSNSSWINPDGTLDLEVFKGNFTLTKPIVSLYDGINSFDLTNSGNYIQVGTDHFKFNIENYDSTLTLIIDFEQKINYQNGLKSAEDLIWSTHFGGSNGGEVFNDMSTDNSDNIYVGGYSQSPVFPTSGSGIYSLSLNGNSDGVLVKFNSQYEKLWATYYGGSGQENIHGVAHDAVSDGIYIIGSTSTTDNSLISQTLSSNPVSYSDPFNATSRTMLARFDQQGAREWASFIKGNGAYRSSVEVDNSGSVYFAGNLSSTPVGEIGVNSASPLPNGDFPIFQALPNTYNQYYSGGYEPYIIKFNSFLDLEWSSYLGGNANDIVNDIAVDNLLGYVYIVGYSSSVSSSINCPSINTSGNFPLCDAGGFFENDNDFGFITRFNLNGQLNWSTRFGGSLSFNSETRDHITGIDTDGGGNIFITGVTDNPYGVDQCIPSSDNGFPRCNSGSAYYQTNYIGSGYTKTFLAKFRPTTELTHCTQIGGGNHDGDFSNVCRVQANKSELFVHLIGLTTSGSWSSIPGDFPTLQNPNWFFRNYHADAPGNQSRGDIFVMSFNSSSMELVHSTYFGGHQSETGIQEYLGTVIGDGSSLLICGGTRATSNFPISCPSVGNPYCQSTISQGTPPSDAFIAQLQLISPIVVGIDEIEKGYNLLVFPNPNNGEFNVRWNSQEFSPSKYQIIDFTGKVIKQGNILGNSDLLIKASNINPGLYFITISDDFENKASTKLLIR